MRALLPLLILLLPSVLGAGTLMYRTGSCGLKPATVTPERRGGVLVYGDSIAVGGWPQKLGWQADAQGCRALRGDPRAVERILAHQPEVVWIAIGMNDYLLAPWTADLFGQAYGEMLDQLRGRTVYAQTPISSKSESRNRLGSNLADYRAAILKECRARPWVQCVDGAELVPLNRLPDGVHPDAQGQADYAQAVSALAPHAEP